MEKTILNINTVYEVASYPYGRLRAIAFFSIEFVKGKGFRSIFQTINPKNNRLNNPKKSTYSPFLYQYINEENGHIKTTGYGFSEYKYVNTGCKFIVDNFNALQLTQEMMKEIYSRIFIMLKMNANGMEINADKLIKLLEPTVQLLVHGMNTGENIFPQINLDIEGINQLKEEFKMQTI